MEQTPVSRLFKSWASPIVTGERTSREQADHSRPWTASQRVAGFFGRLRTAREIRLFRLFQSERRSIIWSRGGIVNPLPPHGNATQTDFDCRRRRDDTDAHPHGARGGLRLLRGSRWGGCLAANRFRRTALRPDDARFEYAPCRRRGALAAYP